MADPKDHRRARDDERLTTTSEEMIQIAVIRLMVRRRAGRPATWSNAVEREDLRRMEIDNELAA